MTDNKYIGVQGLEELISLTKNSLAKKADALQFDVMPDPVKYIGKIVQYVGVSDSSYTRSHFYYSDGTRWNEENISGEQTTQIKIVSALPTWMNADPQVLYVLKDTTDSTMSLYVKDTSVNDAWFTVESGGSFAIVDNLPQWSDANASTIYFKANGDVLTCYVKNTGTINTWYTLSGTSQEIDTALSPVSTNPVQNKVVYAAIQDALSGGINNYKTEETIIGKWINGKPIYRRIVVFRDQVLTKGNSEPNVLSNVLNGNEEYIIDCVEVGYRSETSDYPMVIHPDAFRATDNNSIVLVSLYGCYLEKLIIEYTKTTDQVQ